MSELVLASTTESQAELDRVTGATNTEPSAEEDQPLEAQEQPAVDDQSSERHKSHKFQKRIDGLVRQRREAEDRATAAELRAAQLEAQLSGSRPDASGVTDAMRAEVQQLPHLGIITHFLKTNPEVAMAVNAMPPAQAVAELKRMNSDFEAGFNNRMEEAEEPEPEHHTSRAAATASRAPAPIKPLSGGGTRSSVPLDEMSYGEFRRVRDAQERNWRRGVQR
jgi:hypothetical protein